MSPAERLKAARESTGKNQKEMAKAVGTSFRAWQDYEADKNFPGGKVFESLTRMGFNANWLLTGDGEMTRGGGKTRQPSVELDEELLEYIIIEIIKNQRETDDPTMNLLVDVLAKQTASSIINTYKSSLGLPIPSVDKMLGNFNEMISSITDKLNNMKG